MTDKYPNCSEWFHLIPEAYIHIVERDMDDISDDLLLVGIELAFINTLEAPKDKLRTTTKDYISLVRHLIIRYHMGILNTNHAQEAEGIITGIMGMTLKQSVTLMGVRAKQK